MTIQENVPLAPLTTLGVGGRARFFAAAESVADVVEALAFAHERELPIFVLGGGSNVVIADDGFDGLVLAPRITGITTETHGTRTLVTVGAGVMWDEFVVWAIAHGFAGLECLSGVPGTIGGAVVANLGAYGAQVSDTFVHAEAVDTRVPGEKLRVFEKEECNFSYHDSIFGHTAGRYIVVRATFALSTDPAANPSYRDNRFDMTKLAAALGHAPTREEVRAAVLTMREEKGSLIMDGRVSYKSAGSFFHMPFVSKEQYEKVVAQARVLDAAKEERLRPWAWQQPDDS
ncbi:MAG TPA: FAD-binding protein, partial [Candidatus Paceibacterota bacterium]|nr:FAD-binding protein [Candidatus Paceibacterota bacterium]